MIEVRRAAPEDAGPIADVHVRTWQVAYRGLMPDALLDGLSVQQREQVWRTRTRAESPPVYVAVHDGVIVGFCAVVTPSRDDDVEADVAEIGAIYVDPDAWRRGVGAALIDVARADLRAAGWRQVTLWVLAANQQARDFYARFDFQPDGAQRMDHASGQEELRLRASVIG